MPETPGAPSVFDANFERYIGLVADAAVRDNIRDLAGHCRANKLSLKWCGAKGLGGNRFTASYKGKAVLGVSLTEAPVVNIYVAPKASLERTLLEMSEDFCRLFTENMKKCTGCNPAHGDGASVTLFWQEHTGLCNVGMMEVVNPGAEQTRVIKDYITRVKRKLEVYYA